MRKPRSSLAVARAWKAGCPERPPLPTPRNQVILPFFTTITTLFKDHLEHLVRNFLDPQSAVRVAALAARIAACMHRSPSTSHLGLSSIISCLSSSSLRWDTGIFATCVIALTFTAATQTCQILEQLGQWG